MAERHEQQRVRAGQRPIRVVCQGAGKRSMMIWAQCEIDATEGNFAAALGRNLRSKPFTSNGLMEILHPCPETTNDCNIHAAFVIMPCFAEKTSYHRHQNTHCVILARSYETHTSIHLSPNSRGREIERDMSELMRYYGQFGNANGIRNGRQVAGREEGGRRQEGSKM